MELIIALAILSLVLMGIYSLFGFGNTTYARGTRQSDIQSSIRLATDYITQQVRYSTETKIIDASAIPSASGLQPYENYIYFDSTNNTITHLNKYFTHTVPIGHPGSIAFRSEEPYKLLSVNLQAQNRGQSYNINTEVISMNLHLGTGGVIEGTPAGTPPAKTGNALYFKTATDYMAIKLMPVALLGSTNTEKNLEVIYDRDIIGVDIVSSIGITNPLAVVGAGGRTVVITSSETLDAAQVTFRVTFGGGETYGNTYDYTVIYYTATQWELH